MQAVEVITTLHSTQRRNERFHVHYLTRRLEPSILVRCMSVICTDAGSWRSLQQLHVSMRLRLLACNLALGSREAGHLLADLRVVHVLNRMLCTAMPCSKRPALDFIADTIRVLVS